MMVVVCVLAVAGCSADPTDSASPQASDARPTATVTTASKPLVMDQTLRQQPASFTGRTHVLKVTVRDLHADEAYIKGRDGRCVTEDPPEQALPKAMPVLWVADGDDGKDLASIRGAVVGEKVTAHDWCDAKFTITVPFRPRYQLYLQTAYRGMEPTDAAPPPVVVTKGDSQEVLFVYK
jgi:hypothetical protein